MDKKYLKGKLDKNIAFGLCWLLGWIAALVLWLVDKDELDYDDKLELASIIIASVAGAVLSFTCVVPIYVGVCAIIACVKAFMGGSFQIPGVYQIAKAIIKE